jgi:hypothetical protein
VIGVGNMLWGNDYPHHDAIWPNSLAVIDRIFASVPPDEIRRLTFDNVIELYGIRLAAELLAGAPS